MGALVPLGGSLGRKPLGTLFSGQKPYPLWKEETPTTGAKTREAAKQTMVVLQIVGGCILRVSARRNLHVPPILRLNYFENPAEEEKSGWGVPFETRPDSFSLYRFIRKKFSGRTRNFHFLVFFSIAPNSPGFTQNFSPPKKFATDKVPSERIFIPPVPG